MTDQTVIDLGARAIWIAIQVSAPVLLAALITGLVVSVFQAATQINEQTLSFLPRLIVTLATIMMTGPWLVRQLTDLFERLMTDIPNIIG